MTTIIQILKPHLQQTKKRKKGRKASKPRAQVHVNRRVEALLHTAVHWLSQNIVGTN